MKGAAGVEWAAVQLLVFDVDGVLTDGQLYQDHQGELRRQFSVRDAIGLRRWRKQGGRVAVLTGLKFDDVHDAIEKMGVDYFVEDCADKSSALSGILKSEGIPANQVVVFAGAATDTSLHGQVGAILASRNAPDSLQKIADFVTKSIAGDGAVAEVCSILLQAKPMVEGRRRRVASSRT